MDEIIIGVLSSLTAATLFSVFLFQLRPSFDISKEIAYFEENGKNKFSLKVLNKSRRNAINIKAEVSLMRTKIVPDGTILSHKAIRLKKSERMFLSKYDKKDIDATYAYRITILDDLNDIWTDEQSQFLRIKIFAQDEMSNFGRVFVQDYRTKRNSLKHGQFRFGNSLEIA